MLCTNCSEPLKPIVAIDLDGTLGDYHGHFIHFMETYLYGQPHSIPVQIHGYDGGQPFRDWACYTFNITVGEFREIKLAYRQGAQKRSMPVFAGARLLCTTVRDEGAELWITTTRPYLSLDGVIKDTMFWLEKEDIQYDGLLYDEDKYATLASRIDRERVAAVLDDLPEMYDAAAYEFAPDVPILRRNPYNGAVEREYEAVDLYVARGLIVNRVRNWRVEHDGIEERVG